MSIAMLPLGLCVELCCDHKEIIHSDIGYVIDDDDDIEGKKLLF